MRNLKKMLSLVMALAMIASFMVVGASAAEFTDAKDIDNTEAVSMLVELGVIKGRDTGAFDPTGIVTRAEMAKMICVVLNGGSEPQLGNITSNFTDVKGTSNAWADAYIAFCAQQGIIAGYEDGTFKPGNTVTGTEAAKMLLVAMGYNASIAGFTGANWDVNINVAANKNNLYKSMTINPSTGLSRDAAALMIFNALSAKVVTYEYTLAPVNGTLTSIPTLKEGTKTLLEDAFKAIKVEGTVVANEYANLGSSAKNDNKQIIGSALDAGKTTILVNNYEDQDTYKDVETTFTVATGAEALGRAVTLYVKPASTSVKSTVLGNVIINDDNKIVTDYTGDSIADVADDNNLDLVSATVYANNYGASAKVLADAEKNVVAGVEKIIIDNDNDGKVDYVLLNTYAFGKVTAYSTKDDGSITVQTKVDGSAVNYAMDKSKNVVGFDDVKKDDYVMAAYIGGKLVVEKAEVVTGTLEAFKGTSTLTVDGTAYNVSKAPAYNNGTDIYAANGYGVTANVDTTATFYLDNHGYVVAAGDVTETAYNYAFVWKTQNNTVDGDRVKATLSDGTTASYTVASGSDKANDETIYAYTINSKGEIKLTNPTKTDAVTAMSFTKNKTAVTATGVKDVPSTYATANTAFFYVSLKADGSIDKVSVYTGYTNAPSTKASVANGIMASNKNGKLAAVAFMDKSIAAADVSDHMFIYKLGSEYSDYTIAQAYLAGQDTSTEIKVSNDDGETPVTDTVYTYTIDKDGYYVLENVPGGNLVDQHTKPVVANHVSGSTIVFTAKGTEYKIVADTVLIDNSGDPSTPTASLKSAPGDTDKIAYAIFNGDDEAVMIVIDNGKGGTNTGDTGSTEFTTTVTEDVDGLTVRYYSNITALQVANAIRAYLNDSSIQSVGYSKGTATVTYTGGTTVEYDVVLTQVYKVTVAADAGLAADSVKQDVAFAAKGDVVKVTMTKAAGFTAANTTVTATGTPVATTATGSVAYTDSDKTATVTLTIGAIAADSTVSINIA